MLAAARNVIENIKRAATILHEDKRLKNPFIKIESKLAVAQLNLIIAEINTFLDKLEKDEGQYKKFLKGFRSDEKAFHCLFEPLISYLSERWDNIQRTDAIFPHTPFSKINLISQFIVENIFSYYNQEPYLLLMPNLITANQQDLSALSSLKLHHFVFADDGVTPIKIKECLDKAAKERSKKLFHTAHLKEEVMLSADEATRVINHSKEAFYYYDAICYEVDHPIKDSSLKYYQTYSAEFHVAIDNYEKYEVTATYGECGNKRLVAYVCKQFNYTHDLIEAMLYLPKTNWEDFLKEISDEVLNKLILKNDVFYNAISYDSNYVGKENYDKAVLFCFSEIRLRTRENEKEDFNNVGGRLANSFQYWTGKVGELFVYYTKVKLGGYDKKTKMMCIKLFRGYLISETTANLNDYMEGDEERKQYRDALFQGETGLLANAAMERLSTHVSVQCDQRLRSKKF